MWAGALAGRTPRLFTAKVTFSRLLDGFSAFAVDQRIAVSITNMDHFDVAIRAAVRAGTAADAGLIIDNDMTGRLVATNCTRRTADHANRINTVHASAGNHQSVMNGSGSDKSGIIVVS